MLEWLTALNDPENVALLVTAAGVVGLAVRSFIRSFRQGQASPAADTPTEMRMVGAGVSGALDAVKIGENVERIADAGEAIVASMQSIAASMATLARIEEQGTADELKHQGKRLDDLVRMLDARGLDFMRRDQG